MNDFNKVISFGQLYKGMKLSARGVRWKDSVAGYEINGLRNTYKLRQSILNGGYQISPYQRFTVHEPKDRDIVATRFKDRQFQRSLSDNILYPQITRSFIRDNCACQVGKGVDDALDRLEVHLKRYFHHFGNEGWVLACDIHHYFQETPQDAAMAVLRRQIKDPRAAAYACAVVESFSEDTWLRLLLERGINPAAAAKAARGITVARMERLIAQGEDDGEREARARALYVATIRAIPGMTRAQQHEFAEEVTSTRVRGIGLGSQPSQLVELATLDIIDHTIKERLRIKAYSRYMDDFRAIEHNREKLVQCLDEVRHILDGLGLELNRKTNIHPLKEGVDFLHWHFILTDSGRVLRRMDSAKISKERRKLHKMKGLLDAGAVKMPDVREHYKSWRTSKERGDCAKVLEQMDELYEKLFGEVYDI